MHCDSYTWIDGTYTSSNNTATYLCNANSFGCDSIIILDLTIVQTPQTSAGPDINSCNLSTLGASAAIGTGNSSCNNPSVIIDYQTENTTVTAPSYGSYTFIGLMIITMDAQALTP